MTESLLPFEMLFHHSYIAHVEWSICFSWETISVGCSVDISLADRRDENSGRVQQGNREQDKKWELSISTTLQLQARFCSSNFPKSLFLNHIFIEGAKL